MPESQRSGSAPITSTRIFGILTVVYIYLTSFTSPVRVTIALNSIDQVNANAIRTFHHFTLINVSTTECVCEPGVTCALK